MTKSIGPFDAEAMRAQGVTPGWVMDEGGLLSHVRLGIRLVRVAMLDAGRVLYDHVLHAERGGGVFLAVDDAGRIGLQRMWRPQARDQTQYATAFPDIDLSMLGRISYEVPRGFGEIGESGLHAAVREAEEETHGRVTPRGLLGLICSNTAFNPHLSTAVWGRVDAAASDESADAMEGILDKLAFFRRTELRALQRDGLLYDGFTLAAIALLWIRQPELFEAENE